MIPFAFGMPGLPELMIVLVLVLFFFGTGKLPEVLGSLGKGVKAFKDGQRDLGDGADAVNKQLSEAHDIADAQEVSLKSDAQEV